MPSLEDYASGRATRSKKSSGGGVWDAIKTNAGTAAGMLPEFAAALPSLAASGADTAKGLIQSPGTVALSLASALDGDNGFADRALRSPLGQVLADVDTVQGFRERAESGDPLLASAWGGVRDTAPLVADVGSSFVGTGRRGIELNLALTGIHDDYGVQDTEYGQAWEEGQLPYLVVEDAANLAAVAGGASKLAGAAARAGRGAATARALGERAGLAREVGAVTDAAALDQAAAQATRGGVRGAIGRRLAPAADDLDVLAESLADTRVVMDRAANPLAWPGAVTRQGIKQFRPQLWDAIQTEGRGSMVIAGLRRNPKARQAIDGFVARQQGRNAALGADAEHRKRVDELRDAGIDLEVAADSARRQLDEVGIDIGDADVGQAAVAAARFGDTAPAVRQYLDQPEVRRLADLEDVDQVVSVSDELVAKLGAADQAEARQLIRTELERLRRSQDGDPVAVLDDMEPVIGDEAGVDVFDLLDEEVLAAPTRETQQSRLDAIADNRRWAGEAGMDPEYAAKLEADQNVSLADFELAERVLGGETVPATVIDPMVGRLREALEPDAAARRTAVGEKWERPARWDEVPDDASIRDVKQLRREVAEARRSVDEVRKAQRRKGAEKNKVELQRRLEAAEATVADRSSLLESYEQKVGRGYEAGTAPNEVYVERQIADPRRAVEDGRMDADVADGFESLRQQAADRGWQEHLDSDGLLAPGSTQRMPGDEMAGPDLIELVDERAAEYVSRLDDPSPAARAKARTQAKRDVVNELADGGTIEVHIGNRPGEFVEVTPSQIRWSSLRDADTRVRVQRTRPVGLDPDQAVWQRQWNELVAKQRARVENLPPALRSRQKMVEGVYEAAYDYATDLAEQGFGEYSHLVLDELDAITDVLAETVADTGGVQLHGGVLQPGGRPLGGSARSGRLGAELEREGTATPSSVAAQLDQASRNAHRRATNTAVRDLTDSHGLRVGDKLDDGTVVTEQWLVDNGYEAFTNDQFGARLDRIEENPGNAGVAARIVGSGDDRIWMPKGMMDAYADVAKDLLQNVPGIRMFDKGQGMWKTGVLALSPRWHLGNILGNLTMVWLGAGVSPLDIALNWSEASEITGSPLGRRVTRKGDVRGRTANPGDDPMMQRIVSSRSSDVLYDNTRAAARAADTTRARPTSRLQALIDNSYTFNQFVDNMAHVQVALKLRQNRAKALRQIEQQVARGELTRERADAAIKRAEAMTDDQIVRESLRVAGDFQNMNPFERSVVRRAVPFYAWYRHITKLAVSLPFKSPARTVWTLHLANMYANEEDKPSWLRDSLPVGDGRFLQVSMLNPFGTVGLDVNPLANPSAALGATTPYLQAALMASNVDTTGGGGMLTHAPGSGPHDSEGRPSFGFVGLPVLARQLTNLNPLSRAARQVIEEPVARYDSGEPILSRGRPIESSSEFGRWQAPVGMLGLTLHDVDVEDQLRRAEERRRDNEAARRRYERQRRRAGV